MFATLILALGSTCPGLPNSTGVPARLSASLTEAGDVVELLTEDMQPNNRALVFYGTLPMDPVPFGMGELCLHPLYINRGPSSIATNDGRTLDVLDMQALPAGTVWFQTLYRDFQGRAFNLSNREELAVSPLGAGLFALQARVYLDSHPDINLPANTANTTYCSTASDLHYWYEDNFDDGARVLTEYTPGSDTFAWLTSGGTLDLEYQHWNDFRYTADGIAPCTTSYDSCWVNPFWDTVVMAFDYKVGQFWSRSFVEFDDDGMGSWDNVLDQFCQSSLVLPPWKPARVASVTGASKVRVSIVSWTGHDSYGFGVAPGNNCAGGSSGEVNIDVYRRHHVLNIRKAL